MDFLFSSGITASLGTSNSQERNSRSPEEKRRLDALRATHLLDTAPEEMFDCLTRAACDALGVPIALVSLVDEERQWFKSRCGLDATETHRSSSFCAHVIQLESMMVIEDAALDPRFADNPLVTGEPYIRFYAGVPLEGPDGHPIGSLCVIDRVPRTLSETDARSLHSLAHAAQELIRLRQIALTASAFLYSRDEGRTETLAGELRRMLTRDPLTGLLSRSAFEEKIRRLMPAWREADMMATVVIIDVDNFSGINNVVKFDGGDRLLSDLAQRLRAAVGSADLVARIGSDEFVVLLSEDGDGPDLPARLEGLCNAAQFSAHFGGREINVSCGIGFARFPVDGDSADALINAASSAVRHGKQAGRSALQPYYPGLQELEYAYLLEHDLARAVDNDELELHYQPKVNMATGAIMGVEALVRWRHPVRGMVGPNDFILLAERTGLIVPISTWVIDSACAELARWRALGIDNVSMGVNLSSRLFASVGLVQMIADVLRRYSLPGHLLDLEVTESGSMADPVLATRQMLQLKALGATISVDDFGTGYSSLSYLKDFPIDTIKIDRSFVIDMLENDGTLAIMQGIIATGRRLGMQIVGEGVETVAQRDMLVREQCDIAQGFLYSRPVPGEACLALLMAR